MSADIGKAKKIHTKIKEAEKVNQIEDEIQCPEMSSRI